MENFTVVPPVAPAVVIGRILFEVHTGALYEVWHGDGISLEYPQGISSALHVLWKFVS